MELLQNNHIVSYGHGKKWTVELGPPSRPVGTYYKESVKAAEMIWEQRQGPLYICYSGGLDSEYVLSLFLSLGMKITPVIMRTQYNDPDTRYAFKFCNEKNIIPTVVDLDFDKFVESGRLIDIALKMKCSAYQIATNMWLCSQLDGTVLTGNDPPHMSNKNGTWFLDEDEWNHSQLGYFRDNRLCGTPFFLHYTPEMLLSFLLDPTMRDLVDNKIYGKLGTNSTKVFVYNNNDGSFELEQRQKLHGYEVVESNPIYQHPDIKTINKWKSKWSGVWACPQAEVVELLGNYQPVKNNPHAINSNRNTWYHQ